MFVSTVFIYQLLAHERSANVEGLVAVTLVNERRGGGDTVLVDLQRMNVVNVDVTQQIVCLVLAQIERRIGCVGL